MRPGVTVEAVDELIASLQSLRSELVRLKIHDPPGYVPPTLREPLPKRRPGVRSASKAVA
jgi:hypothetical protein